MVEGFVFLAEGSDESEINLGDAHFGDFFRTMKVDFLNETSKLVDIVFHADGSIFAERVESGFSDVSTHIGNVAIFILQTRPNLCSIGHPKHLCLVNLVEALQQCFDGKNVLFFPIFLSLEMRFIGSIEIFVRFGLFFFAENEFVNFVHLECGKSGCCPKMVF